MEVGTTERYASGGPGREPTAENVYAAFCATAARLGDDVAIRTADDSVAWSWNDVAAKVKRIAGGLAQLGLQKGDTVALLLDNRPEFIPCDLAAVSLGGVPFSIYQTSSPEQIAFVAGDAGAKIVLIESAYLDRFKEAAGELPDVEHIVVVDGEGGTTTLEELEAADPDFDPAGYAEVGLDDLLTLIYTSGTTGPPKGVQLTHRNLMALTSSVEHMIDLPESGGRVISWLPAAHIAERGAHYYLPVLRGLQVTICPDPRRIVEFLPQVRPTWFFAVPRIWEKLKAGLETQLHRLPEEQREPALQGLDAAIRKLRLEQAGEEVPDELEAVVAQADEQLFSKLRTALGLDELIAVNAGAAPTPLEVLEFFHALGIPVGELWGMSETCGVATLNPPDAVRLGTVGPPVPGVELRLAEDGEVMVKGDMVMPGYRNQPERTAETFEDGWLLTGDIGELDEDGYLRIVDRKKELIINAAGKNMSPANIEAKLKTASPLIGQCVAIGDRRPFNTALIVLDPDFAPAWAQESGLGEMPIAELARREELIAAVQEGVEEANSKLSRVEQIKKFTILEEEWAPGGDELTPTMKLKRRPIAEKYERQIEDLYVR